MFFIYYLITLPVKLIATTALCQLLCALAFTLPILIIKEADKLFVFFFNNYC